MGITFQPYPDGYAGNGYTIFGPIVTTGKTFFVSSASGTAKDDSSHGSDQRYPWATLAYALGNTHNKLTANNGDVVVVMPNHAETVTGVGGLACSLAGVTVIGLGTFNQRPRFLMDGGTTVTFAVSGADFNIQNCVFASGHASVVTCFAVTAAGFTAVGLEFENNTTNENFLTCIKATSTTDNNADGMRVLNCRWVTSDSDDLEMIEINANLSRCEIADNVMISAGTASPLVLVATGKILTGAWVARNTVVNAMTANELFISMDGTTSTGAFVDNRIGHADVTTTHDAGWEGKGFRLFNNLSVSVDNLSGFVLPAIDVNL